MSEMHRLVAYNLSNDVIPDMWQKEWETYKKLIGIRRKSKLIVVVFPISIFVSKIGIQGKDVLVQFV